MDRAMIPTGGAIPLEWFELRLRHEVAPSKPVTVTVGLDGFGGVIETPLTVELTVAWASRVLDDD
jgi:hypothetical protein